MTGFNKALLTVLGSRKTFYFALFLCFCSSFATFWYGHLNGFSDEGHYWNLATGLHQGQFSAWYFLPVSTPDTLRIWGYPFFIYLCQFISPTFFCVQIIQFILYILSVVMMLKLIKHYYPSRAYQTAFLLLLIPNNHIAFYAGVLIAECTFTFFTVLFAYIYVKNKENTVKYIWLAIVCFILFQLKPVFLLFPFFFAAYLLLKKRIWRKALLYILVFSLLLVPFGYWNKVNHGVFKITPLEGGFGVMYQGGYWDYRLPTGFKANYYWGVDIDDDLVQPSFISDKEKEKAAAEFVSEWEEMLVKLKSNYYTPEDSLRDMYYEGTIPAFRRGFKIYSAGYTLAREKMIRENLIRQVKNNPWYYFKTRVYTFFRQWFTGINRDQLRNANSITDYIKVLYPFLVTFIFIFGGLIATGIQLARKKIEWKRFDIYFLLIGYIAFADLPFGVMSRYTVHVHLFILMFFLIIIMKFFDPIRYKLLESDLT